MLVLEFELVKNIKLDLSAHLEANQQFELC